VSGLRELSPSERQRFRRRGKLFLLLGFGLFALSPVAFMVFRPDMSGFLATGEMPFPLGFVIAPILGFGGMVLIIVGAIYAKFGYMRAASEISATETAGAVGHSSKAWARGVGQGLHESGFAWGGGGKPVVKVKCRSCGYLESEDARFCSQCTKAV
jgi:hypothetical protein